MRKVFIILFLSLISQNIFSLTLEEAIKIALKNNFEIQSQNHILKSTEIKLKSAKALRMPSFVVDSSYTQLDDSKKITFDTPIGSQSFNISEDNYYEIVSGFKLKLYTGGYISSQIKAAKSNIEIERNNLEEKKLDIIYQTQLSYLNILILNSYKKIAEKHVEALQSHLQDVKHFYNQGLVPYVDILQTQVKLKEGEQLLTKIENNIKVAKTNLALILGWTQDKKINVSNIKYNLEKYINLNMLYTFANKNRPILKKIDAELEKMKYLIKMTKADYKPKVIVFGGYKYSNMNDSVNDKDNFLVQLNLKFNLDWNKTFHDVNSLKEKLVALKFLKKDINNKILLQVKKAYEEYNTALKNLEVSKSTVKTAEEYFRIIKLKYKEGLSDNSDVLDAEAMFTKAKMDENANYYSAIAKKFAIERAIGGKL